MADPARMKRIAILGGGIAGLAAAYELTKQQLQGADLIFTLFEATDRLGGIVDTARTDGFVLEGGPDGWVTDKPWARDLAIELGLESELITSNDAERITYILRDGNLQAMPDGMRMMVPTDLDAVDRSPLFSAAAKQSYRDEPARAAQLKEQAPQRDESVASFVERHFGTEILNVIGAPLLNGVFGGDVHKLSVQAVMHPFVQMEREHGSLILALQQRARERGNRPPQPIFTSLRNGTAALTDAIIATLSPSSIRKNQRVESITRTANGWTLNTSSTGRPNADEASNSTESFDELLIALPVYEAQRLLSEVDPETFSLLDIPGSSALTIAYAFPAGASIPLPKGFGFLAIEGQSLRMLAATFSDQKFPNRAPQNARAIRVYYGGAAADDLHNRADLQTFARNELASVLGPLPTPQYVSTRFWPRSLPQYHLGHLERMAALDKRVANIGNLHLLGNGYRGVGLPDLIRDARNAARALVS